MISYLMPAVAYLAVGLGYSLLVFRALDKDEQEFCLENTAMQAVVFLFLLLWPLFLGLSLAQAAWKAVLRAVNK